MIIRHNMMAMNTARELKINARKKAGTTEKLSSGYKINRAADGSAELAISEKMRKLIRGLGQDHDNITEGISVVQIADGALGEVVEIIQRMRELTIKAYNGTNSMDDKLACQQEVDQLLEELDRIRSTVKYNEQYLLQGDPSYKYTEVTHVESGTVVENVTFDYEAKGFPAWIPYDKKLTLNNAKVGVDNTQVTEDKVAIINMGLPEEKIYGNFEGSDGRWTDTMEDNYSSVMDFSALSSASGPAELVAKLKELSGSGFSVTCSTCRLKYAVYFTSDEDVGINDTVTGVTESAKVDLTDLINRAGGGESGASIAQELVSRIAQTGNGQLEHFTAFQPDKDFPDKLIIYDWRDDGFNPEAAQFEGDVITSLTLKGKHSITTNTAPYDIVDTYDMYTNFYVQAGVTSQFDDKIRIHLPDLRLETMHIKGYSVFEEGYYKFGFEEGTPGRDVTSTVYSEDDYEVVMEDYVVQLGGIWIDTTNAQGEPTRTYMSYGSETRQRPSKKLKEGVTGTQVTSTVGAVPSRTTKTMVYRPSSLSELDCALDYVLAARAQLGADQNRLEHALKITDNIQENTQHAESLIRDTDMANEMVRLSIQNILEQAGVSMLTQANQTQSSVLSLLQG